VYTRFMVWDSEIAERFSKRVMAALSTRPPEFHKAFATIKEALKMFNDHTRYEGAQCLDAPLAELQLGTLYLNACEQLGLITVRDVLLTPQSRLLAKPHFSHKKLKALRTEILRWLQVHGVAEVSHFRFLQ